MSSDGECLLDSVPVLKSTSGGCICEPTVRQRSCAIICSTCGKSVQVACLLQFFKSPRGEAVKNTHDWLKRFIEFTQLRFTCSTCRSQPHPGGSVPGVPQLVLSSDLSDIKKYVEKVSENVSGLILNVTCLENSTKVIIASDHSSQHENSSTQPLYASVALWLRLRPLLLLCPPISMKLLNLLSKHTMQKQKAMERETATIAIRNLGEYDSDAHYVIDRFDCFGCRAHIINMIRIGWPDKSSTKSRLLKVELSSVAEKTGLLRAAKYLKDHASTAHIHDIAMALTGRAPAAEGQTIAVSSVK